MRLRCTDDVARYLNEVEGFLLADPVVCSVLLTTPVSRTQPADPAAPNLWCWAEQHGAVVAVAQQTPPFGAYVAPGDPEALGGLARLLHDRRPHVPSVGGVRPAVRAFAEAWPGGSGGERMATYLYACTAANLVVPSVPGSLRLARDADTSLLRPWGQNFVTDTGVPDEGRDEVGPRILAQRLWVWEYEQQPMCMAAVQVPVGGVARVSLVYTPPEQRGRGWAAACVAGVTRLQHEQGLTCMLYADAANPTSNGVYTRIGYQRVAEAVDQELLPGP